MDYRARFQCVAGCAGSFPLEQVIYTCPSCGELLEVRHDREALRALDADAWKALFESRYRSTKAPYGSGVWGKKEWVAPGVRDESVVSLGEGATPLLPAGRYATEVGLEHVWLKLSGQSHTGSFKDLGMTVLVSTVRQMILEGAPIRAIACASTGDTSAALAAYCAAAEIPAVVLLPAGKISVAQLLQPLAHGARVLALDTDFDGCMALVKRLAEEPGIYLANSMNALRLEGQKTVAIELTQQLDWEPPDWVIIPGGNLGNVSALGAGFDMMLDLGLIARRPRICVAQAERANPLYRAFKEGWDRFSPMTAGTTQASAIRIGNPVSIHRAIRALRTADGIVEQASELELAEAAARADRTGAYTCPHTGVALAALEKLAARGTIAKDDRVVVVSTAHGLKFSEFKQAYHEGAVEGKAVAHANRPIELPSDYDRVLAAILE